MDDGKKSDTIIVRRIRLEELSAILQRLAISLDESLANLRRQAPARNNRSRHDA